MTQRNNKGHFIKGNQGGPGRPPRTTETEYLDAAMSNCSPEKWGEIVEIAVNDCFHSNASVRNNARNFILKVLYGNSPNVLLQYANIINSESEGEPNHYRQSLADRMERYLMKDVN